MDLDIEQSVVGNTVGVSNSQDVSDEAGYDSGVSDQVSADGVIHDPVLEQYQTEKYQAKWCEEIENARKERKDFLKRGYKILECWADKRSEGNKRYNYNLLYANTEIKRSCLYARTPSPDIKRRFNDPSDQVSRVAALLLTRVIESELDEENFDHTFNRVLFDRLLPGMGVAWLRLEQVGGDPQLVPGPHAGQTVIDEQGNEVPHPLADQMVQTTSPVTYQFAEVEHVSWDDFLWSPCRTWRQCRWMAKRIPMSKQAVQDRFGNCAPAQALRALSYEQDNSERNTDDKDKLRVKNQVESTTDVWEIWDRELRKVWWIAESAPVPLDVSEDNMQFPGFFPTPCEPLGRYDGSSTIPHADYSFAQDQYRTLDDLNDRFTKMVQAAQLKWAYDAQFDELQELFSTTNEFGGVPVDKWTTFAEKGGFKGVIDWAPWENVVSAAKDLANVVPLVKEQINEIEGISDLFRGESTPNETTAQTQQKGAFGTARISIMQQAVAKYCEELLRLKAHLICRFYTPQMILQRVGSLTQADQQLIPQAIQLLKNEQMRNFKLTVSVDAIQLPNWNLEKGEKTELFTNVMQALQQVGPMIQQNPAIAPFVVKLMQFAITGYKGAQYLEGELDSMLQQLVQGKMQAPPPPPSPAEIEAQVAKQRSQTDLQIAGMEAATKRAEAELQAQTNEKKLALKANEQRIQEAKIALQAHDNAMNTVHNHTMDRLDAQNSAPPPVIPIPVPVNHNGEMPHHVTAIVAPK